MGMNVAVVNVPANTSTGTQDITVSGFGTVKGYLIWVSRTDTINSDEAHAVMSFGMCDGTRETSVNARSQDGKGTTNDVSIHLNIIVGQLNLDVNSFIGIAVHDNFITDGIRIDWTQAPLQANRIQVMLLGGDDLSVHVGTEFVVDGVDVAHHVTDPGFQADAVLFLSQGFPFPGLFGAAAIFPLGAGYDNGAGITQGLVHAYSFSGVSTSATSAVAFDDRINHKTLGPTTPFNHIELTGFEANGFEVTMRVANGGGGLSYMALASSTNKMFAGMRDIPTGTGNQAVTGLGFKPQAVAVVATGVEPINTNIDSGNNAGNIAFGMFDGINEDCLSVKIEDQRNQSDTVGRWSDSALFMRNKINQTVLDASFVSFDSDGYTLDYASNNLADAQQLVIAFEENAPDTVLQDPILSQGIIPFAR